MPIVAGTRERHQQDHGWLPPRVEQAAAQEQAALLAERSQRAFLRLLKAFRDNRRLFASLVVAGGQVNLAAGPQLNVQQAPAVRPASVRTRPGARRRPARVRTSGGAPSR